MNSADVILYSGGAIGAESCFGEFAEKYGIDEVNFSFEGHETGRMRGIRILNHEELKQGDVSMAYVSSLMHRSYPNTATLKKILQTIWFQINSSQEIFVIGTILPDNTVKGGTGWGAEFAKLCNKKIYVFDVEKNKWFLWNVPNWVEHSEPVITNIHFAGTGTRNLSENGKKAIEALFARSFGK
ncbi:MAG: hypothetical protein NT007_18770 [Candidatus Kapabacteria bacterium]|nr:hypothetical protein [Candidatus Kapabacteria bacterium]